MTAPLKLKPPDPPSRSHAPTQVSLQRMLSQNNSAARPQSALTQVWKPFYIFIKVFTAFTVNMLLFAHENNKSLSLSLVLIKMEVL